MTIAESWMGRELDSWRNCEVEMDEEEVEDGCEMSQEKPGEAEAWEGAPPESEANLADSAKTSLHPFVSTLCFYTNPRKSSYISLIENDFSSTH